MGPWVSEVGCLDPLEGEVRSIGRGRGYSGPNEDFGSSKDAGKGDQRKARLPASSREGAVCSWTWVGRVAGMGATSADQTPEEGVSGKTSIAEGGGGGG